MAFLHVFRCGAFIVSLLFQEDQASYGIDVDPGNMSDINLNEKIIKNVHIPEDFLNIGTDILQEMNPMEQSECFGIEIYIAKPEKGYFLSLTD